jgi:hypothetical protein
MSFDARRLMELLPAVYRQRDAELATRVAALLGPAELAELAALETLESSTGALTTAQVRRLVELRDRRQRGPLGALLYVLAEQIAVLEENMEQLYDDQFVETAIDWAVPYLGDLIGYRLLHGKSRRAAPRAEVAHTVALRRRKGTAAMLEQLARDVTGWDASAVEFFSRLATSQSMNHVRLANVVAPSMRAGKALELVGSAFDRIPRTLEVRGIASGGGRYNIPNVGLFLWRIGAQRLVASPAVPHAGDASGRRFRFSPLGNDLQLISRPEREGEITHLAEPSNVPLPISRRRLWQDLRGAAPARLYGAQRSLAIWLGEDLQPAARILVCNLSDDGADWAHDAPADMIAIDPLLGRLVVGSDLAGGEPPRVTFHYAAPDDFAGGDYDRWATFDSPRGPVVRVPTEQLPVALADMTMGGVVELVDCGRYSGSLAIELVAEAALEVRAAEHMRPTIVLDEPLTVRGGAGSRVSLNGLLIAGNVLDVPQADNGLRELRLVHTTLVPGRSLQPNGAAAHPGQPSVVVGPSSVALTVQQTITGPLIVPVGARAQVSDSIVDAGDQEALAYAGSTGASPGHGADLTTDSTTFVGRLLCGSLAASNAIFMGGVEVRRRQEGCLRFSYAGLDSVVPRRHRCQPGEGPAAGNVPHFQSLRYGTAQYGRLAAGTPVAILRGSEDESEMGAFRWMYEPQRVSDLHTRLDEYLRVGLQAGIFHET